MIMSMWWDYVPERRPPTDLLFINQVVYEYGKSWWNDTGRRNLLSRPPELSGYPTSSHLVAKQEELGEGSNEFGLTKYLCSYFEGTLNMP
jgi:hypothetical protein